MSRTSRAVNSILFGFVFRIVTILGPFITRIIVNWTLGKEFLGISGVFSSILSMLCLTELGFSSAIAYKCYSLYANQDIKKLNAYLHFYRKIYRVVGSVIIVAGVCVTPFLGLIVRDQLPVGLNMYIVYYIYLLNTAISYFIASYRTVILTVAQRQDIESKIAIVFNLLMYIVQIVVLLLCGNYYLYLLILPLSTIIINVVRYYITNKIYPELCPDGDISEEEKKSVYDSITPLIGHRLQGTIVISADNIIISMFIGVVMVAEYNNYHTIIAALSALIVAIYAAVQPGIGNSMATESIEKNYGDFNKFSFGLVWIVGWMSISSLCLFQDFIGIAYGNDSILPFSTVFLLVIQFYIWKTSDIIMTYRDVVGKWSGDALIPYVSGIFNLIINILLVKFIGVNGVIISTILAFLLFSIPNSLRVLFRSVFKVPIFDFLKKYFANTLLVVIAGVITYALCLFVKINNPWICLAIKALICLIVPNIFLWLLWRNKQEYVYFQEKLLNRIKNQNR
ncbi:MAG: polysaccharide biosynthesis C-terminal domain-containing protein [Lachnospiraceae bacterium]|nr:polysaccharide biosynthesis C-terminal domain-containing protein [Lachnospiraceae bacterium]